MRSGAYVLADFRLPPAKQPWLHAFHVGVVSTPRDDVRPWRGRFTEAQYCAETNRVKVRYAFGTHYEPADSLTEITREEAELDPRDKVLRFLGPDALAAWDRGMGLPGVEAA